ncbi:hypothetical protein D051_0660 [Vibrio parahaemolyticus VPCR-2010]|uniref:hypothetical protein n=1 Tax=Vibrio parahaemolyticus TaxID=670 RepID=UPI00038E74E5|nr:hypothetical protein D051_0660 [Vibrio parahaemolyticus VPCR-2010]
MQNRSLEANTSQEILAQNVKLDSLIEKAEEMVNGVKYLYLKRSKKYGSFVVTLSTKTTKTFRFDCLDSLSESYADAKFAIFEDRGQNTKAVTKKRTQGGIYMRAIERKNKISTEVKIVMAFTDNSGKSAFLGTFDSEKISIEIVDAWAKSVKHTAVNGSVTYQEVKDSFNYIKQNYVNATLVDFLTQSRGWFDTESTVKNITGTFAPAPVVRAKGSRVLPDNTSFQSRHGRGNIIVSKDGHRMTLSFRDTPIKTVETKAVQWLNENIASLNSMTDSNKQKLKENWNAFLNRCQSCKPQNMNH